MELNLADLVKFRADHYWRLTRKFTLTCKNRDGPYFRRDINKPFDAKFAQFESNLADLQQFEEFQFIEKDHYRHITRNVTLTFKNRDEPYFRRDINKPFDAKFAQFESNLADLQQFEEFQFIEKDHYRHITRNVTLTFKNRDEPYFRKVINKPFDAKFVELKSNLADLEQFEDSIILKFYKKM